MTTGVHWHDGSVARSERAALFGHRGATVWFTGLSGSGKSTVAAALERELTAMGVHAFRLDGDNVRTGLNADLGFSDADRAENIRRLAEVASLFADAGVVVLVSAISPFRADRERARERHANHRGGDLPFIEVHVDAPIEVCERRDPKGLYRRARAGEIASFTGIDSAYEPPAHPEVTLRTDEQDVPGCVQACLEALRFRGVLPDARPDSGPHAGGRGKDMRRPGA